MNAAIADVSLVVALTSPAFIALGMALWEKRKAPAEIDPQGRERIGL